MATSRAPRRGERDHDAGQDRAHEREGAEQPHVRGRLHVRVLDAPRMLLGRQRELRLVGEAPPRVVDVRHGVERLRRALPADTDERMVEEDPPADVHEDRALGVCLDVLALGVSSPRSHATTTSSTAARLTPTIGPSGAASTAPTPPASPAITAGTTNGGRNGASASAASAIPSTAAL